MIIKFHTRKTILIDTGWLLDSMTARSIRNFPVAFRAIIFVFVSIFIYFVVY